MGSLLEIDAFLSQTLKADHGVEEPMGVLKPALAEVCRFGVVLEPWAGLAEWVREKKIDALLIHRPWGLALDALPEGAGLLVYHRAFDLWLTSPENLCLLQAYGLREAQSITWRDGESIGFVGSIQPIPWSSFLTRITADFDGYDSAGPPTNEPIRRAAFMGAMNRELVQNADVLGADVYITGQVRQPGMEAIRQTGMGLVATGHRRAELWGLRCLSRLLAQQFPAVQVINE